MSGRKNTVQNTGKTQPGRNGGSLRVGNPGNRGGTGRPTSVVRERLLGSFAERVAILEQIADDTNVSARDRLRALDLLARYGLGSQQDVALTGDDPVTIRVVYDEDRVTKT